jgi:hypothetical protein
MARGGARPGAGRPKDSKGLADTSRPLTRARAIATNAEIPRARHRRDDAIKRDAADAVVSLVGDIEAAVRPHGYVCGVLQQSMGGRPAIAAKPLRRY